MTDERPIRPMIIVSGSTVRRVYFQKHDLQCDCRQCLIAQARAELDREIPPVTD